MRTRDGAHHAVASEEDIKHYELLKLTPTPYTTPRTSPVLSTSDVSHGALEGIVDVTTQGHTQRHARECHNQDPGLIIFNMYRPPWHNNNNSSLSTVILEMTPLVEMLSKQKEEVMIADEPWWTLIDNIFANCCQLPWTKRGGVILADHLPCYTAIEKKSKK